MSVNSWPNERLSLRSCPSRPERTRGPRNTFLEVGVHMACALPEVEWLEYSFQNFEHLVDLPVEIRDGWAYAPDRPGHGLVLSEAARLEWARPEILPRDKLGAAPITPRAVRGPKLATSAGMM